MTAKDRIILALDVPTRDEAVAVAEQLRDSIGMCKIGLELLDSEGPAVVRDVRERSGLGVFFDGKFHDIPNTVAGAVRGAVAAGANMLNVHATGGKAMMEAAAKAATETAEKLGVDRPTVIAVTVLTSIDDETLASIGVDASPRDQVIRLATLAQDAGLDGVVASPKEIEAIREACGPDFLIVTPGIRPTEASLDDQKRVATPKSALDAGADYLVIGRPIRAADDPVAAAQAIIDSCEETA